MGAEAGLEGRRRDLTHREAKRRARLDSAARSERRPSRAAGEGAAFSMHVTSRYGLVALALYAAAAFLLLQRGAGAPVTVLALAAVWRWGFLLGATSAVHSLVVLAEPVAAAVALLGSLFAALGAAHALKTRT